MLSAEAPAAVVVDLDDTLYPQDAYLTGAARATTAAAANHGICPAAFFAALSSELTRGSARGRTINRALLAVGKPAVPAVLSALVDAFVEYEPEHLELYEGVARSLATLRRLRPLACLTDGRPRGQRAKLAALGLEDAFDLVLVSDALGGRAARKPAPVGLLAIAEHFGVAPSRLLVIGDRPEKDVAAAAAVGARAIRIRQGEYANAPDDPVPYAAATSFSEAAALARSLLSPLTARP